MMFTDWDMLKLRNVNYGLIKGFKAVALINDEYYDVIGIQPHGFILVWEQKGKQFKKAHSCSGDFQYSDIFIEKECLK